MKRLVSTSAIALALSLAVSACGGPSSSSTTPVVKEGVEANGEMAHKGGLLGYLPAEGHIVFGGQYAPLMEYWKNSALKEPLNKAMEKLGNSGDMNGLMECWMSAGANAALAGTFTAGETTGVIRMAFSGFEKATFTKCSEAGGFKVAASEDGKFIEIQGLPDGKGGTTNAGYYFVNSSTAYYAQKVPMDGSSVAPSTRADLEADLKWSAESSAVSDPKIQALVAKADQTKAMWFSGTAEGTPAAKDMVGGHGWIDADANALSIGFAVEVTDPSVPKQAVDGFEQAKGQVAMLDMMMPGASAVAAEFLEDVSLNAEGSWLKGQFKLSNTVVEKLVPMIEKAMEMM